MSIRSSQDKEEVKIINHDVEPLPSSSQALEIIRGLLLAIFDRMRITTLANIESNARGSDARSRRKEICLLVVNGVVELM